MKKNRISKNWIIKKNKDLYFKKSKIYGYRSRSAFKLIEMNKKFKFLKKNLSLLDLGSCPGGWSQVARKEITKGKILAVDIKPMEKIYHVDFIKGDFFEATWLHPPGLQPKSIRFVFFVINLNFLFISINLKADLDLYP